jgi:hypothetical protein
MAGYPQGKPNNLILSSPHLDDIVPLKFGGASDAEVARYLCEIDDLPEGTISREMVSLYLKKHYGSSSPEKWVAMRDVEVKQEYRSDARAALSDMKQEMAVARAAGDFRAISAMSKEVREWMVRAAIWDGLAEKAEEQTHNFNIKISDSDREKDALIAAVKEWLMDKPEAWDAIKHRAKQLFTDPSAPKLIDASFTDKSISAD